MSNICAVCKMPIRIGDEYFSEPGGNRHARVVLGICIPDGARFDAESKALYDEVGRRFVKVPGDYFMVKPDK